jgi:hypothetical protein
MLALRRIEHAESACVSALPKDQYLKRYSPSGSLSYIVGGAEEDRTPDPLLAKQVLSQLSYSP